MTAVGGPPPLERSVEYLRLVLRSEEDRLAFEVQGDPYLRPMLNNFLGGIKFAIEELERFSRDGTEALTRTATDEAEEVEHG